MAMTGTMLADFSSFTSAVKNAELSLKTFETGGAKVESQLSRMGDSFSGKKVIQEATLMAEVFTRAGGAASFTEKELARMGAVGSEAAAKLKALGQDVPPGIARIAAETKNVDSESSALIGTVKNLAAGFLAMFTARAAFNFVKGTAEEASALKDLAQQTHINVEELQTLAGAMSEFGVDADTLGKGLFTLSRKISKGDDSVSDALKQMGMELKDVRGLNGEELFMAIMRGLSKLQGGLRDETASELFGSRLGMAMAGASEDIEGTLDTWKRLNTVMSTETVDSLDKADEAIKRTNRSLSMMAANLLGPVTEGFNVLFDAQRAGMSNWDFMIANAKDLAASLTGTGSGTEHLARLLDQLNQKTEANKTTTQGATASHREFVPALESTAGATKFAREETERLLKEMQKVADLEAKRLTEENREKDKKGVEDMIALTKRAAENKQQLWMMERDAFQMEQANKEKAIADELALQALQGTGLTIIGQYPAELEAAGAASRNATDIATAGFTGFTQQVQLTGDAIRAWIELMQYSAKVNAVLSQNSLFTSTSQRENVANIGMPQFAEGGPVLQDGPIYAHAGEYVIPKGGGGGVTVNNTFNIVDTESNIARRVSDTIMRTVTAGSQLKRAS